MWEGSGNVICLDVLRVMQREPDALAVMLDEIGLARDSTHPAIGRAIAGIEALMARDGDREWVAREVTERLALALQASLLVRHAPAAVGDAFCAGRLGEGWRGTFGTLPPAVDGAAIVARAMPIAP